MGRKVSDFESKRIKEYYQASAFKFLEENDSYHQAAVEASINTQEEFDRPRRTVARHTSEFRQNQSFNPSEATISEDEVDEILDRGYDEENDPSRNDKGEANKNSNDPSKRMREAKEEFESKWLIDDRHEQFDNEHRFYLTSTVTPMKVTERELQNMKEDYSEMLSKGLKMSEIADKWDMPEVWFKEMKLILDWTHADDIFTDSQYLEQDTEQLQDMAIKKFRQQLREGVKKEQWEIIRENHERWVDFEQSVLNEYIERLSDIDKKREIPVIDKAKFPTVERDFSVILSPFDMHYGMYATETETGDDFNREIAEDRLIDRTERLLSNISVNGQPDKFYVGIGSDFFHVDTDKGTTSSQRVTPMSDGTPGEILAEGTNLMTTYIDMLSQVAPVEIIPVPGNHDMHSTISLLLYINAFYRHSDRVEVANVAENSLDLRPRQYRKYGNNLIGFTHGCEESVNDLSSLMSHEAQEDWGVSDHKIFMTGHKHHEIIKDDDGVLIYQLPALMGHDRYHFRKGYNRTRRALSACLLDKDRGIFSTMYAPLDLT